MDTQASNVKISLSVLGLYLIIGAITYLVWS